MGKKVKTLVSKKLREECFNNEDTVKSLRLLTGQARWELESASHLEKVTDSFKKSSLREGSGRATDSKGEMVVSLSGTFPAALLIPGPDDFGLPQQALPIFLSQVKC